MVSGVIDASVSGPAPTATPESGAHVILLIQLHGSLTEAVPIVNVAPLAELVAQVDRASRWPLSRTCPFVKLIQVPAMGTSQLEVNAFNNDVSDLERFGMRFVASPCHVDVLLVPARVGDHVYLMVHKQLTAGGIPS